MKILAIESSCDETAAAIVENGTTVLASSLASSAAMHQKYGGIVPEVAARAQLESILPVLTETLTQGHSTLNPNPYSLLQSIDAIAVTVGPGLIGSLLVGVETAKTLAFVTGKPLIPVNHVLAHMYANFVHHPSVIPAQAGIQPSKNVDPRVKPEDDKKVEFPAISLVVSGGHTELFLMTDEKTIKWLGGTIDDAAGEAFDKTARLLGFGHGGGPAIQKAAEGFKIQDLRFKMKLPRPLIHEDTLNFSFSGFKTAVLREWQKANASVIPAKAGIQSSKNMDPRVKPEDDKDMIVSFFAHEIQEAITDVLVTKTLKAAELYDAKSILISGGVAANSRLREKFSAKLSSLNSKLSLFIPPIALCTDNAIYIASYAYFRGKPVDWHEVTATPGLSVEVTE